MYSDEFFCFVFLTKLGAMKNNRNGQNIYNKKTQLVVSLTAWKNISKISSRSEKTGLKYLIFAFIRANTASEQAYDSLFVLNLSYDKLFSLNWSWFLEFFLAPKNFLGNQKTLNKNLRKSSRNLRRSSICFFKYDCQLFLVFLSDPFMALRKKHNIFSKKELFLKFFRLLSNILVEDRLNRFQTLIWKE